MTDDDWRTCTTRPKAMLTAVRRRASGRKLQLLACGVCRLVWEHIPEPACKAAVAAAERFADGLLGGEEFQSFAQAARQEAVASPWGPPEPLIRALPHQQIRGPALAAALCVEALLAYQLDRAARSVIDYAEQVARGPHTSRIGESRAVKKYREAVCALFRELFPPPSKRYEYRPAFAGGGLLLPDGRVFHTPDAADRLAESVVADGTFDRLPILADALEEADCPDVELLHHLRHGTGHARGCWAVDAVLGRA